MIRRDYFLRMVQELTQVLTRILFLKKAQEYPKAVDELENALARFWNLTKEQIRTFSLDQWIEQCRQEQGPMGEKLVALADLFKEQSELYALEMNIPESQRTGALSLGLYLEAVASPGTVISVDLLDKIDQLIEGTSALSLPGAVWSRLLNYYETRGMLAKAEDALFDWLDTGDADATAAGLAFYERAAAKDDRELEQGGLPRDEIEQGREQLLKLSGSRSA